MTMKCGECPLGKNLGYSGTWIGCRLDYNVNKGDYEAYLSKQECINDAAIAMFKKVEEVTQERDEARTQMASLRRVLRDIRDNYDHEDREKGNHDPSCCRVCKATKALADLEEAQKDGEV